MTQPSSSKSARKVAAAQGAGPDRTMWVVGAVVVILGIAVLAAVLAGRSKGDDAKAAKVPTGTAAASVIDTVTNLPPDVTDAVGAGNVKSIPRALDADPKLGKDGKPVVLYVGAEYCPFCAAQRWAIVNALSRFGTFSKLKLSHSSAIDTYPNTPTFSFYGSSYDSKYVDFQPVETATNQPSNTGNGYEPLESLTSDQTAIFQQYSNQGSIPFLYLGKYVISGATFQPDVLQGMTAAEIAKAMEDPKSEVAKGAVGSANLLTALICKSTDGKPGDVCNAPGVKAVDEFL